MQIELCNWIFEFWIFFLKSDSVSTSFFMIASNRKETVVNRMLVLKLVKNEAIVYLRFISFISNSEFKCKGVMGLCVGRVGQRQGVWGWWESDPLSCRPKSKKERKRGEKQKSRKRATEILTFHAPSSIAPGTNTLTLHFFLIEVSRANREFLRAKFDKKLSWPKTMKRF